MKVAAWLVMAGLAHFASAARAAEPASEPDVTGSSASAPRKAGVSDAVPRRPQGVRAAIDPTSGALVEPGPSAATSQSVDEEATNALVPQDFNKTRIEYLPDGRVHVQLNGQLKMAAFARLDEAGRPTTWCAPNTKLAPPLPASAHTHGAESGP